VDGEGITSRSRENKGKGEDKDKIVNVNAEDTVPGNCYSAACTSYNHGQQRFTDSEAAADWYELMVPQHIMWPRT